MSSVPSQQTSSNPTEPFFMTASVLKEGDRGGDVIRLQHMLNEQGANLSTDGAFEQHTKKAVKRFQQTHGLLPNGIVNAKTLEALLQKNERKILLTVVAETYTPHESLDKR